MSAFAGPWRPKMLVLIELEMCDAQFGRNVSDNCLDRGDHRIRRVYRSINCAAQVDFLGIHRSVRGRTRLSHNRETTPAGSPRLIMA